MDTSKASVSHAQHFSVSLQGAFGGRFMNIRGVHFQGLRSYLTISVKKVGSLSLPLCVAPGVGEVDLKRLKTKHLDLSLAKTYLGESVFFLGKKNMKKSECFLSRTLSSIRYKTAGFWVSQAIQLSPNEFIEFQGRIFDEIQCYLKALSLSNNMSFAWFGLGCALNDGEKIEINGNSFNEKDCYREALQFNNFDTSRNLCSCWSNLGRSLDRNEIINVFDDTFTAKQCYLKSLSINIDNPAAWFGLGNSLECHKNELITINGKKIGARECFVNALELDNDKERAWVSLGVLLNKNDSVQVGGETYGKHECLLEALHHQ